MSSTGQPSAPRPQVGPRTAYLWGVPVLVVACVILEEWLFRLGTGRPSVWESEPQAGWICMILAGSPFLAVAVMAPVWVRPDTAGATTALVAATVTGGVLTVGFWGFLFYQPDLRTGADIALGGLMLVSPLLVGVGMAVGYRVARRVAERRRRDG